MLVATLLAVSGTAPSTIVESSLCPCASANDLTPVDAAAAVDFPDINVSTYGIGCHMHDQGTSACDMAGVNPLCANIVPVPEQCQHFGFRLAALC